MSLPVQNNRRDNRSRNINNPVQRAQPPREWVLRVPAPSAIATSTIASADVSPGATLNGNNLEPNSRPVPPLSRNRGYPRSRGGITGHHMNQRKEREEERQMDGNQEIKGSKDVNLPLLVQEIQDKLMRGAVECMICCDMVRRSAPIWSCSSCYSIFHLACIKKWARAPTSVDLSAEKSQGFNWRCPGCQAVQLTSSKEIRYVCFCGKRQDPSSDLYLMPHSCGEPCGKSLEKEVPGSGMTEEDLCPHSCVLQCHPGPCPPCKAFAPPRRCPCGKEVITTRCKDRKSVFTCGKQCDKLLDCGRHHCQQICHVGPCEPCEVLFNASCFCKKNANSIFCGDLVLKGEIKVEDGVFSCNSACEKKLGCENHICYDICHPGPCGDCYLLPSKIDSCCCGKTKLRENRKSCLDAIPTCSHTCGKSLPCGAHSCKETCHIGACEPCPVLVTQKCRCGSTSRTVECYRTMIEKFTCDRPCGRKKSCGRHRCSERCCPLLTSRNSSPGDFDPHLCSIPCGKKLRCGSHSCHSLCHSGHCPPCLDTIFTDLTCTCGRTSIPPPQPCGTPPPSCHHPCSVPQPCGHPSTHSCHFGDCPPCTVPIAKECVGRHVVLRNIPCGSKGIRCNKLCGKTRQCGLHACARICHPLPCDTDIKPGSGKRASCGQPCGAPRRDCRHTCTALCHPSAPCPDGRCEFPVTISCSCGRITATVPCDAGGNNGAYSANTVLETSSVQNLSASPQPLEGNERTVPRGQRNLKCDDECAKTERKKVLADAFGVTTPNPDALHLGENATASEVLTDMLRREPKWVLAVEERCKYLVLGRGRGGINAVKVHVFCPMSKEKRDVVRLIADRWKLSVNSAGWDPKRFVIVHGTSKSKAPARLLGVKGCVVNNMLQPPVFDPLVDMDPRLVVALFDLPGDADISALVLRFGGECELAWLNDKNAVVVFGDPARAATAMKRLDQGSLYYGAVVVPQKAAASNANAWGATAVPKDGGGGAASALKGNPWKKVVMQEPDERESCWGAEEWTDNSALLQSSTLKDNEAASSATNRWSVLESGASSSSMASVFGEGSGNKPRNSEMGNRSSILPWDDDDVVDDWEKAYD